MTTNVLVVGSRNFRDKAAVFQRIRALAPGMVRPRSLPLVISGGARGVDTWARQAADECELPFLEMPADWNKDGIRAGYIRNERMVERADLVIAFWDGESRGTRHTIGLALKSRKPLEVHF